LAAAGLLSDLEAARDDQWSRFMRVPHNSREERDAEMMWELLVRASNAVRRSLNSQISGGTSAAS
jgi:hypothetical protein